MLHPASYAAAPVQKLSKTSISPSLTNLWEISKFENKVGDVFTYFVEAMSFFHS